MKSVMISIKPKWCELIASCKKTVEVRKTRPKCDAPFKCYIYCTKGGKDDILWVSGVVGKMSDKANGKVIGKFVCDKITQFAVDEKADNILLSNMELQSCVGSRQLELYAKGNYYLYGWHISNLVIYDKPKELSEFRKIGALSYDDWLYGIYNGKAESDYDKYLMPFTMTRPPQSWCYCEECKQ